MLSNADCVRTIDTMITLLKGGWCKGHYAEDASGGEVSETDAGACKFCMAGARYRAFKDLFGNIGPDGNSYFIEQVGNVIRAKNGWSDWTTFNDDPSTSLPDVLKVLEETKEHYAKCTG